MKPPEFGPSLLILKREAVAVRGKTGTCISRPEAFEAGHCRTEAKQQGVPSGATAGWGAGPTSTLEMGGRARVLEVMPQTPFTALPHVRVSAT